MMISILRTKALFTAFLALMLVPALAEDGDSGADLANQLANPIANLISVPFQTNYDFGAGAAGEGFQFKMNVQPVIPISINENYNLISRTILPLIYQKDIFGSTSQDGLGDVLQSMWLSPVEPTSGGWITGVGPAFLFPTASSSFLGAEKWAAGPTAIALKQENGWTYGALVNQLWTMGGDDSRADVNSMFFQPFLTYVTPTKTTFALNAESTYDWTASQWTVPINLSVSQLVNFQGTPMQFQLGGRYYADAPTNGPEWGLRFAVTLLFPEG